MYKISVPQNLQKQICPQNLQNIHLFWHRINPSILHRVQRDSDERDIFEFTFPTECHGHARARSSLRTKKKGLDNQRNRTRLLQTVKGLEFDTLAK